MALSTKNILGTKELTKDDIQQILDTADSFKEISTRAIKKVPALRGKTIINLFFDLKFIIKINIHLFIIL